MPCHSLPSAVTGSVPRLGRACTDRRAFYDKRISQEVDGEILGEEFKGYVFRCVTDRVVLPVELVQSVCATLAAVHQRHRGARPMRSPQTRVIVNDVSAIDLVVYVP